MKKENIIVLFVSLLFGLIGCGGVGGHSVPDEWYDVRDSLVNKQWERDIHDEEENDIHEIWIFKNNGRGTRESIIIYKNGKEKRDIYEFPWVLTLELVININDARYWEIKKMNCDELEIYETWQDPTKVPGQEYRGYQKFQCK